MYTWVPRAGHPCCPHMPCSGNMTPPDDFYRLAHRKLSSCVIRFKDAPQT